ADLLPDRDPVPAHLGRNRVPSYAAAGADRVEHAPRAVGLAGGAHAPPVEYQGMVHVDPLLAGEQPLRVAFYFCRVVGTAEAQAVGKPQDVSVDGNSRPVVDRSEYDVGGLAADAGQFQQRVEVVRHLAVVPFDQRPGRSNYVPRLGPEESDRTDQG